MHMAEHILNQSVERHKKHHAAGDSRELNQRDEHHNPARGGNLPSRRRASEGRRIGPRVVMLLIGWKERLRFFCHFGGAAVLLKQIGSYNEREKAAK